MDHVLTLARRISAVAMLCGGALVMGIAALLSLEIVLRQVFGVSLSGVDEVSGFVLAVAAAWSFGHALLHKAHIRIDTAYQYVPRSLRVWLDLLALAALAVFVGTLAWHARGTFLDSVAYSTTSQSALQAPLALPQGLWLAGLVWFLVVIAVVAAACVSALARRDADAVVRLAGMTSVQEQLAQELESTAARQSRAEDRP